MMVLKDPVLELDGMPPIDLANTMRQPALAYDAALQCYPVWLFSDLKRHDMGKANAAACALQKPNDANPSSTFQICSTSGRE